MATASFQLGTCQSMPGPVGAATTRAAQPQAYARPPIRTPALRGVPTGTGKHSPETAEAAANGDSEAAEHAPWLSPGDAHRLRNA